MGQPLLMMQISPERELYRLKVVCTSPKMRKDHDAVMCMFIVSSEFGSYVSDL